MGDFQRLAARHFSDFWFECPALQDGARVLLRPLGPADTPLLRDALQQLSQRSLYLRFHGNRREFSDDDLRQLIGGGENGIALGAFSGPRRALVAIGGFARCDGAAEVAEFSLAVVDSFQNRGLGALLLSRLRLVALERGITRFAGDVLDENGPMLALLHKLDARVGISSRGVRPVELPLS